jgi:hypothetical protein
MPAEEKKTIEKPIRLVWDSPEDVPVTYSNHLQVTHAGGNEFTIFFGYLTPLLTHGLTEEEIAGLPDTMHIEPLTQIVVTPEFMKQIVEVFSKNLANYEKNFKGDSE